jgi:hypothetical protein
MNQNHVSFLRHSGWVDPGKMRDVVTVIGCGAVGSHAALLLAKMGVTNFELWDADVVENHNLSNQAFDVCHLGTPKVDALASVLTRFNPEINVSTNNMFFDSDTCHFPGGPVISAVDSMSARREIMNLCADNFDVSRFYEMRLGFDFASINFVDNLSTRDVNEFLSTLKDDSDVEEGPCSMRMCTTLVYNAVSIMVHQICRAYVAAAAGDEVTMPRRFFVVFNNDTGGIEVIDPFEDTVDEAQEIPF